MLNPLKVSIINYIGEFFTLAKLKVIIFNRKIRKKPKMNYKALYKELNTMYCPPLLFIFYKFS